VGIKLIDMIITSSIGCREKTMLQMIRPALISLLIFTLITGVVYPVVVTGLAQVLFPCRPRVASS